MKKTFLLFPLFSLFLTAACNKDRCIQGIVQDSKTGEPIVGAKVDLEYEYSQQGSLKRNYPVVKTDQDGEFSYSADEKYVNGFYIKGIRKEGYSFGFDLEWEDHEARIKLAPLDGILNVNILNETGTHDSIYVGIFNKCNYKDYYYGGESYTSPSPLILQKGEMHNQTFSTCVDDSTTIQWRFTQKGAWFHTDSLLVKTADTMFFKIAY
jgi:hypothetical protein